MKYSGISAIWICLFFMLCFPLKAWSDFEGCVDSRGKSIVVMVDNSLKNVAMATRLADGTPVIYYNRTVLSQYHPSTRLFIFLHECAHHALGHTLGEAIPEEMEQEADCWAIRELYRTHRLDEKELEVIAMDMAELAYNGSSVHLPGPDRAKNLFECLEVFKG